MKTINEMRETVQQFLIANGFDQDNYFHDFDTYHFPNKADIVTEKYFNEFANKEIERSRYEGRCVMVQELYRSNGSEANQSIQIDIVDWHGSSGHRIFREKIYSRHGEKKTNSVLASLLETYHS